MSGRDSGSVPPGTRAASAWLALAVVLAGCTDDPPTAPAAAAGPSRAVGAPAAAPVRHEASAAPGTLVVRRTTSSARGAKGGRTERRETWSVADSALSRRAGVVTLRGTPPTALTPETAARFVPTVVLQLPARAASAVCTNAPAWQRESKVGDLTVVARGRGDEPWSSLEVWSAGRLVTRTTTAWARHRGSWRLVSQEDVAIGDGTKRTLAVDRAALARANDVELPRVGCADPKAGYVPPSPVTAAAREGVAAPWSAALGPVGLARLELAGAFRFAAEETCTPTEEAAEAACEMLRMAVVVASASLAAAATTMWTACMPPAVLTAAPCIGAVAAYIGLSAGLAIAQDAYRKCKEEALRPVPCTCSGIPLVPASDVDMVRAARLSSGGAQLPLAAPAGLDCAEPEAPASGGGGSGETGDGPTGYWATVCTNIDHYDEWGDYLYTEFLGCTVVWIA